MNKKVMEKVKKYLILVIKIIVIYYITETVGTGFRIISGIIDGQHGAPSFLTPAFTYYGIFGKSMQLIGYLLLVNLIPVKGRTAKGLMFYLLFWSSAYLPMMLGMMGGQSAYIEKEALSVGTIFADSAGFLVKGLALGFFLAKKEKPEKKDCNRTQYLKACIVSMLLFPAILGLLELISGAITPNLYCVNIFAIVEGQQISFTVVFYLFLAVSGALFPVFYRMTEYNRKGNWLFFTSVFAWFLWLPIILIMILFGTPAIPTFIWGVFMVGAIYLDMFVFTRIMKPKM